MRKGEFCVHNVEINGGSGGTLVIVYPGTSGITTKVQDAIYKYAVERAGIEGNRYDGTTTENYYVLRKTIMLISSTECGFMDYATDIKYILNPEWSRKIALGIAEGICEIFGGEIQTENAEPVEVMSAGSFDENLAGTYVATTGDLKLRAGANSKYAVLDSIPKVDR